MIDHRFGAFAAVLSALEYHVEQGEAHPDVVRYLGEALLALAIAHGLPPPSSRRSRSPLGCYTATSWRALKAINFEFDRPTGLS